MKDVYIGNANLDGETTRGWIVGHFVEQAGLRQTGDVEIKWSHHKAGEERPEWVEAEHRTTVCVLVSGSFNLTLSGTVAKLRQSGDYVMWGQGVAHTWECLEDSLVLTVRWPSIAPSA